MIIIRIMAWVTVSISRFTDKLDAKLSWFFDRLFEEERKLKNKPKRKP